MLATLIVCVTVLVLAERWRPLACQLIALRTPVPRASVGIEVPPFPDDLMAKVLARGESWAQEDLRQRITEDFLEARRMVDSDDEAWIAVRERLGTDLRIA